MATLVFDCETIPDLAVYARLLHLPHGLALHEYEAAWQSAEKPFKAELQQIVSLAVAWIAENGTLQKIATLGPDESTALQQFFQTLTQHHEKTDKMLANDLLFVYPKTQLRKGGCQRLGIDCLNPGDIRYDDHNCISFGVDSCLWAIYCIGECS